MVHYTRVAGPDRPADEAAEVARAARDVGVRVGFAVAMRDRNPLVYGPSEPMLAALLAGSRERGREAGILRPPLSVASRSRWSMRWRPPPPSPMFDVQYGPAGVQWCTHALLEAIADASKRTGRRIHMHLLETSYQRDWADANYPDGILAISTASAF